MLRSEVVNVGRRPGLSVAAETAVAGSKSLSYPGLGPESRRPMTYKN